MLLMSIIMGLGEKASGELLGLRGFLEMLDDQTKAGFKLLTAEYDNPKQLEKVSAEFPNYNRHLVIGHSLGGDEAYNMAASLAPDILVLLDPVRPSSWGVQQLSEPYEPLENCKLQVAFYGTKDWWPRGQGFLEIPFSQNEVYNVPLHIGHADIPSAPAVTQCLTRAIAELIG